MGKLYLYLIKHAKFGDDRLRGSGVVAGQISAFPIDFVGRPYNTLTLPCERVISDTSVCVFFLYRFDRHAAGGRRSLGATLHHTHAVCNANPSST